MNKCFILIILSITLFSCKDTDETDVLPSISFIQNQDYLSHDSTLLVGDDFTFSFHANANGNASNVLRNISIIRKFEDKPAEKIDTLVNAENIGLVKSFYASELTGTEQWIIQAVDAYGNKNDLKFKIITTNN